eukprot:1825624-Prymnesium_polylepis.1
MAGGLRSRRAAAARECACAHRGGRARESRDPSAARLRRPSSPPTRPPPPRARSSLPQAVGACGPAPPVAQRRAVGAVRSREEQ